MFYLTSVTSLLCVKIILNPEELLCLQTIKTPFVLSRDWYYYFIINMDEVKDKRAYTSLHILNSHLSHILFVVLQQENAVSLLSNITKKHFIVHVCKFSSLIIQMFESDLSLIFN